MARGLFHKVGGQQASDAKRHGFIKVDRATARRFFDAGKTVIVTGSRVDPVHFLSGFKLAIVLEGGVAGWAGGCPELLPDGRGGSRALSEGSSRALARVGRSPVVRGADFDTFMAAVDRQMVSSPYGPAAVTFVLRKEFPRMDRGRRPC
jgi:hypothetical protein